MANTATTVTVNNERPIQWRRTSVVSGSFGASRRRWRNAVTRERGESLTRDARYQREVWDMIVLRFSRASGSRWPFSADNRFITLAVESSWTL